jgi:hypothetical protein
LILGLSPQPHKSRSHCSQLSVPIFAFVSVESPIKASSGLCLVQACRHRASCNALSTSLIAHCKGNVLPFSSTSSTLTLTTCPTLTTVWAFQKLVSQCGDVVSEGDCCFPLMSKDFSSDRMKKEDHLPSS